MQPEAVRIQHEYVTDATFVPRATRAFMAILLLRPQTIVVLVVWLFVGLLYCVLLLVSAVLRADGPPVEPILVLIAFLVMIAILVPVITLRKLKANVPVGSRFAVGLGEATMRIEGPLASSDVSYRAYRSARSLGGFVFLRMRETTTYGVLPLELFPGADLERLRAGIARASA